MLGDIHQEDSNPVSSKFDDLLANLSAITLHSKLEPLFLNFQKSTLKLYRYAQCVPLI